MTEEFLHHIWKFRLFNQINLLTENGETLQIIKPGDHNTNAGPDFFNAKLKIGNTEWAGNVEIHIHASDWEKHRHQNDTAYNNIILHAVYENDKPLLNKQQIPIPTLVLKNLISDSIILKYASFKTSEDWIPCEKSLGRVPDFVKSAWLERLLVERLEEKSQPILNSLQLNNNNWEETFYQHLARNFGFKINAIPFELLAKALPNATLAKHKNSLLQVEAMLFGCAGFLENQYTDKYVLALQNEYQFLKKKFALKPIAAHLWKFLRLRPANFPTLRVAQFAALVYQSQHLFSKILECTSLESIHQLFNVQTSEYWKTHYLLDKASATKNKSLGKTAINILIINTIVPFLFIYGKQKKLELFNERAIQFLEKMEPENNAIITHFKALGFSPENAFRTQALLQLKNKYCANKYCLDCAIGNNLLKN